MGLLAAPGCSSDSAESADGTDRAEIASASATENVFLDTYGTSWVADGWSSTMTAESSVVMTGTSALKVSLQAWGAAQFDHRDASYKTLAFQPGQFAYVSFDLNPGAKVAAGLKSGLSISTENNLPEPLLSKYYASPLQPNTWTHVRVPIADISAAKSYYVIALIESMGSSDTFYIDNVRLEPSAATSPPTVTVAVSPKAVALATGATQQFTGTVTGAANTVAWSVVEASGCGSVNASGRYTAPAAAATCHVKATSTASTSAADTATVTVTATTTGTVSVAMSPATATLVAGTTRQLAATVTGAANTVTWSMVETSGCGSVSTSGLYSAPASVTGNTTCLAKATSTVNTSASATAAITVTTSGASSGLVPLDPPDASQGWLSTSGSKIYRNGQVWVGRGANVPDTRKCWGTTNATDEYLTAADANVIIDSVTDSYLACDGTEQPGWGADFLRIPMGTYVSDSGDFILDTSYRQNLISIVNNLAVKRVGAGKNRPVYVELSIWNDPAKPLDELPTTAATGPNAGSKYTFQDLWRAISTVFYKYPYVVYGITNEPNGITDTAGAWQQFNDVVQTIRDTETSLAAQLGQPVNHHLVSVQGLNGWARDLSYYVSHPISAGGGANVVYETHVYNPQSDFNSQFEVPSATLPVIIGEFGPDGTYMAQGDLQPMMTAAEQAKIPYIGWYYQTNDCWPGMLNSETVGTSGGRSCLTYTNDAFGQVVHDQLSKASP